MECIPLLQDNNFAELIVDDDGYVLSVRLTDNFFQTYGLSDFTIAPGGLPRNDAGPSSDENRHTEDEQTLNRELSRVTRVIMQSVRNSGTPRGGVHPVRTTPFGVDLVQMLRQRWDEQNGHCALCSRPIFLHTTNRLLQLSADRIDSANPAYDQENTQVTHLACNLGKNDASLGEWRDYLVVVREAPR